MRDGVDSGGVKNGKKAGGFVSHSQGSRRRPTVMPASAPQRQTAPTAGPPPPISPKYDLIRPTPRAPWAPVSHVGSSRDALVSFHCLDALVSEANLPCFSLVPIALLARLRLLCRQRITMSSMKRYTTVRTLCTKSLGPKVWGSQGTMSR
jgi:hypothetical protein